MVLDVKAKYLLFAFSIYIKKVQSWVDYQFDT